MRVLWRPRKDTVDGFQFLPLFAYTHPIPLYLPIQAGTLGIATVLCKERLPSTNGIDFTVDSNSDSGCFDL